MLQILTDVMVSTKTEVCKEYDTSLRLHYVKLRIILINYVTCKE
jgi:hypothetical protein